MQFSAMNIHALQLKNHTGIGVDLGFYKPHNFFGSTDYPGGSSPTDIGNFLAGGHSIWWFTNRIALESRYNIYKSNSDFPRTGYSLGNPVQEGYKYFGSGDFSVRIKPFDLIGIYLFKSVNPRLKPYAGFGVEYTVLDYFYHHDSNTTNDYPDFTLTGKDWGWVLVGGFMYFPSNEFSIRLDLKYSDIEIPLDAALNADPVNGTFSKELFDLEGWSVQLGFTYYFSAWEHVKKQNRKIRSLFRWEENIEEKQE